LRSRGRAFDDIIPELHRVQPVIRPALPEELLMRTTLDDASAIEHENLIGVDDRR
jgi:hypothetical protein